MAAIEQVRALPRQPRAAPAHERWYDESVVAEDLRYTSTLLGQADDEYRDRCSSTESNAFLDGAGDRIVERHCRRSSA